MYFKTGLNSWHNIHISIKDLNQVPECKRLYYSTGLSGLLQVSERAGH